MCFPRKLVYSQWKEWQALDIPAQRGDLLRELFTDVALEVDSRAQGYDKSPFLNLALNTWQALLNCDSVIPWLLMSEGPKIISLQLIECLQTLVWPCLSATFFVWLWLWFFLTELSKLLKKLSCMNMALLGLVYIEAYTKQLASCCNCRETLWFKWQLKWCWSSNNCKQHLSISLFLWNFCAALCRSSWGWEGNSSIVFTAMEPVFCIPDICSALLPMGIFPLFASL